MSARTTALEEFHRRLGAPNDVDGALRALRDGGYSKVESIVALVRTGSWDMNAAKRCVHESPTWSDVRARDDAFHDRLEAFAEGRLPDEDGGT